MMVPTTMPTIERTDDRELERVSGECGECGECGGDGPSVGVKSVVEVGGMRLVVIF